MQLATKYFGEIACDEEDILHFPAGLFGFEEEQKFVLLPFAGSGGTLLCLQSVTNSALAFVVMDPFYLWAEYAPSLQPPDLKALGVEESDELGFYVLCVVKDPISASTVNLKCPVAINIQTRTARQVILETYEMRHLLSEFGPAGEGQSC
ncbi:MAG: flagellar assembly protein FliW [Oscillospiraceae bacterium]|nr:flagellar assembly protein FliW [Oscillospiraceae bacterium]